jgi:hypothetical protein
MSTPSPGSQTGSAQRMRMECVRSHMQLSHSIFTPGSVTAGRKRRYTQWRAAHESGRYALWISSGCRVRWETVMADTRDDECERFRDARVRSRRSPRCCVLAPKSRPEVAEDKEGRT